MFHCTDYWSTQSNDIASPEFFNTNIYPFQAGGSIVVFTNYTGSIREGGATGDMLRATDALAKAFYSTIKADLGGDGPNILTEDAVLANYTSGIPTYGPMGVPFGPALDSYVAGRDEAPQISPSTIRTSYLCQVPTAKPMASLLVAVLLADLVFLNVLWTIAHWIVVWRVESKDAKATWCEGCLQREAGSDVTLLASGGNLVRQRYEFVPGEEFKMSAAVRRRSLAVVEQELGDVHSDNTSGHR
jgi:hypothetical protein